MTYKSCNLRAEPSNDSSALSVLFDFAEFFLAYSTKGALKILRQIFKFRSGSNARFGQACAFVILPAAHVTYVFFHFVLLLNFLHPKAVQITVSINRDGLLVSKIKLGKRLVSREKVASVTAFVGL